jgi:hypothetical protein
MSTLSRAIAGGAGMGALSGGAIGVALSAVLLFDSGGTDAIAAFIIYGAIGGMVGLVVGILAGAVLGLIVGMAMNLLLGPASQVPRRPEQIPMARALGAAIGLVPLIAIPRLGEWWPLAAVISLIAMVAIAMRVPKIVGITSLSDRSPNP